MSGPKLPENEKKQRSIFLSKTLCGEWQSGVKGDFLYSQPGKNHPASWIKAMLIF